MPTLMSRSTAVRPLPISCVQNSRRNPLLGGLSREASALLTGYLRDEDFSDGAVLWHPGEPNGHVYFPVSGLLSIRVPTSDGNSIEVGTVGPEGAIGFQEASATLPPLTQAVVQAPGQFTSIPAQAFNSAMGQSEELRRMATTCMGWLFLQAQQIAACNAVHAADARFCRWLLRASDALGEDTILATQETIAQALGIRRTTATLIAQQFQLRGVISYRRGRIAIRDRDALQAAGCDCCHVLDRDRWPSELLSVGKTPMPNGHPVASWAADV